MGQSQSAAQTDHVRAELLVSALIGEVKEEDYFARSTHVLDNFKMDDPTQGRFNPADAVELEDAFVLANPGYLNLEHGYVRLKNGSWYIAVLTDLGYEVNGEMFDWWFRHCDNTEKYKWWHPQDHITGNWDPQYYAVMPHERKEGHYIDHIHIVEEKINGVSQSLQIEFVRPSRYFDVSKFEENGITACLTARIYVRDPTLGLVAAGHLMHMVRESDGRSELRSRFWLGDITYPETVENIVFARTINYITSFKFFRLMKMPVATARGLWVHCSQEMHCLKEFLPHYYKKCQEMKYEDAHGHSIFDGAANSNNQNQNNELLTEISHNDLYNKQVSTNNPAIIDIQI